MKRTSIVQSIAAAITVMFMAGTAPVCASELAESEVLVETADSQAEYKILHTTEVFELPASEESADAEDVEYRILHTTDLFELPASEADVETEPVDETPNEAASETKTEDEPADDLQMTEEEAEEAAVEEDTNLKPAEAACMNTFSNVQPVIEVVEQPVLPMEEAAESHDEEESNGAAVSNEESMNVEEASSVEETHPVVCAQTISHTAAAAAAQLIRQLF